MRVQQACRRIAITAAAVAALVVSPLAAGASAPHTPPATPTSVSVTSGGKSLVVSWSESSGGTINYVATARATGRTPRVCRTRNLGCTILQLVNGVVYNVSVVAKNTSGASAPSADVTATVGVPGPPLAVHAIPDVAAATISWSPPNPTGTAAVSAYVATASPGGYSCYTSRTVVGPPARSCEIAGLSSGTTYTVTVSAANSFGSGAPSKPTAVMPS